MKPQYKITYTPNPARISDTELTAYINAYKAEGHEGTFDTYEDKTHKAHRLKQKKTYIKPIKTREQKAIQRRSGGIRLLAHKHHDAQYSVTHHAMHKREMTISRAAYYKANHGKFTEMYDESQRQKKADRLREQKRSWQYNWRKANPEKAKEHQRTQRNKPKTPEQITKQKAYAQAYRDAHKEETKAYNDMYKAKHKERLNEYSREYMRKRVERKNDSTS